MKSEQRMGEREREGKGGGREGRGHTFFFCTHVVPPPPFGFVFVHPCPSTPPRNQTTKNWDAHTAPLIPLARTGTSFSFVVQCLYEPSWTTSIGVTAEGLRAGRGSTEMAQLSIGEKGAVQWESDELAEYLVTVGSVLEFQVDAVPHAGAGAAAGEDGGEDRRMQVEVNVYVHTEGRRVHGKAITFLTEAKHVHLSCYCYAPGQGWRIVNNLESLRAA